MNLPFPLLLCVLSSCSLASAASLTLDNSTLYGSPGETVGFGFTLTSTPDPVNDPLMTPYLVVTDAEFVDFPVGVFTPYISQNFVVVGPDDAYGDTNPLSEQFSIANKTGLGAYQINSFEPAGVEATGNLVLTFDEYSVSPNDPAFDPIADGVAYGQTVSATATVIVGPAPVAVSEPSTLQFILIALLGGFIVWRRRFRPKLA